MNFRFTGIAYFALMLGTFFVYFRIPYLDIVGIPLFFLGLLTPVLELAPMWRTQQIPNQAAGVKEATQRTEHATNPVELQVPSQVDQALIDRRPQIQVQYIDICIQMGSYLERAATRDPLAIPWLVQLIDNPDPTVKLASIRAVSALREPNVNILDQLKKLESIPSNPAYVQLEARNAMRLLTQLPLEIKSQNNQEVGADHD